MSGSQIFMAEEIAERMGVSGQELRRLEQSIREEFPDDDLMYELHMLRALKSFRREKQHKESVR